LAALGAHIEAVPDCPKPVSCLDAFSATGVMLISGLTRPTFCHSVFFIFIVLYTV